ncbi:hypothetical protein IIU_03386 [Bacillus cereus VD133]|uniref:Uncharacterized protein n=1 Tax=Bacillus cereus VD133 TaxID=1053233 RepID=A0A9W5V2G1_BACCE|nr:hypothetical protein IIU_03386 [Bacillus cereus VD133]
MRECAKGSINTEGIQQELQQQRAAQESTYRAVTTEGNTPAKRTIGKVVREPIEELMSDQKKKKERHDREEAKVSRI